MKPWFLLIQIWHSIGIRQQNYTLIFFQKKIYIDGICKYVLTHVQKEKYAYLHIKEAVHIIHCQWRYTMCKVLINGPL